ncbi:uncharacterized protein LOC111278129 isoform X2 [Durio zibethinus]|uniref:Uncharacterized protein LOC111278129 isoform X2 n=1 Tax=Durio zibethinus TaxID=66656 RepID=A0A6P5WXY2_DURZI|nr:uncharacterized protein LOC111278129 isoform X2 [Durio zibethinus]
MAAAVLSFQSISHLSSSFLFNKLRKPVSSPTEIADKSTPFISLQLTVSSASDGNRRGSRPRKSSASGRKDGDESKKSSDGSKAPNSSSQKEIIALFRRIQSSISEEETASAKTKTISSSKNKSIAESVLDLLHESSKNGQDTDKVGNALRWKTGVSKKRQEMGEMAAAATQDFKLSRPPSNFVKRSPIPYATAPGGKNLGQSNEVAATNEGLKLANMEKLKLPELKKLARAKGIKGYSRLKKIDGCKKLLQGISCCEVMHNFREGNT